jgi:hypothetical protein
MYPFILIYLSPTKDIFCPTDIFIPDVEMSRREKLFLQYYSGITENTKDDLYWR